MDFIFRLQHTAAMDWFRESGSLLGYPAVLFLHTLGLGTVAGLSTVQLVSRHWVITDGDGKVEHVQGPGVVGEQPVLEPGEAFEYTSFCPLPTPIGSMHGSYQMLTAGGARFDAEIAAFSLAMPTALN